jgi:threonine dehydrogenase-like Zn-dependent dehydrogenase
LFPAADQVVHVADKPLPELGPHSILLRTEACGICFSDTKLLHAFDRHPRKSAVVAVEAGAAGLAGGGFDPGQSPEARLAELAAVTSYVPAPRPTVPGHEPVARIVAVGPAVAHHAVGERVLVQTDYRHLPTATSNAAFGYNLEGALQEYVVVDERVAIDPATGERFLIPVKEAPAASQLALIEPWACVEAAYAWPERQGLKPGGRLLVVTDPDRAPTGLDRLVAAAGPARLARATASDPQLEPGLEPELAPGLEADDRFDDIVYFGSQAGVIETLGPRLAAGGLMSLVTGGAAIDRPVQIDLGRVHYDLIRYCGTAGNDPAEAYARLPASGELRPGDRLGIVGAAGPMGLMHTMRAAASGVPGLAIEAVDVDDARLAHLAATVGPFAAGHGVPIRFRNSNAEPLADDRPYGYLAVMVPAPALIAEAVRLVDDGGVVNAFAGFAVGTMAPLDLNAVVGRGVYLVGTSGSRIEDMKTMLAKVESGVIDTNVSLDAVTGMAGVADALAAVAGRTSGGKIMVYPSLPDLGYTPLAALADRLPQVAAHLDAGRWSLAAEQALLALGKGE